MRWPRLPDQVGLCRVGVNRNVGTRLAPIANSRDLLLRFCRRQTQLRKMREQLKLGTLYDYR